MRVYRILGRKAQLVSFPDGNDKVLPAGSVFRANARNSSVRRLMRLKPPACRELTGDDIPEEYRKSKPAPEPKDDEDDVFVVVDGE